MPNWKNYLVLCNLTRHKPSKFVLGPWLANECTAHDYDGVIPTGKNCRPPFGSALKFDFFGTFVARGASCAEMRKRLKTLGRRIFNSSEAHGLENYENEFSPQPILYFILLMWSKIGGCRRNLFQNQWTRAA